MKRIAVFHNLPAGGARRHTFEQVRELAKRGYDIHEFTQSTADLSFTPFTDYVAETHIYELSWTELQPVPVPGIGPYLHLRRNRANLDRLDHQSRQIAAAIDRMGFDLVFVKDCRYTIAPYVLRYLETPSVFYMHSDPVFRHAREFPMASGAIERSRSWPKMRHEQMIYEEFIANLRSANRILTNSRFTRERILQRHGVEAHVVYPGVNLDIFTPTRTSDENGYVLSAGNLHPRKGHWFVIESVGCMAPELRPKLIIATPNADDRSARQLQQHATDHHVEIEICSVRDSSSMARLYSNASLLLFAPHDEWLGLVALEAMACGTPVVGVREGGLVETVVDGETGYLVEREPERFAERVSQLLDAGALCQRLGRQARTHVETYWNWSRAVDDLEVQFEMLLSHHASESAK